MTNADRIRSMTDAEYAKAEAEGRLLVLPCKAEDMVYVIERDYRVPYGCAPRPIIVEHKTDCFMVEKKNGAWELSLPCEFSDFGYEGIYELSGFDGKCYATREKAEKAVEEMKNDGRRNNEQVGIKNIERTSR